jgi:hypothetical protein
MHWKKERPEKKKKRRKRILWQEKKLVVFRLEECKGSYVNGESVQWSIHDKNLEDTRKKRASQQMIPRILFSRT